MIIAKLSDMLSEIRADYKRCKSINRLPTKKNRVGCLISIFPIIDHRIGLFIETYYKDKKHLLKYLLRAFYLAGKLISVILFKTNIDELSVIGGGLSICKKGNVIIAVKRLGTGCTIGENVTIGHGFGSELPEIGDNVTIGSNSIIYGGIRIGNNVLIDDNTVLTKNVPDNCRVGGNPGKVIHKKEQHLCSCRSS